ncbi:MAG: LysM domain-containing protein [Candidatus Bipolaricaulia bacterium]
MPEGNGLSKLAKAFSDAKSAGESISLDEKRLHDNGLCSVEHFNEMLRAGFRLQEGSLNLDVSNAEIGDGTMSPLRVTHAAFDTSLKFLGLLSSQVELSLTFAIRAGNGDPVVDVQIEATIKKPDWRLPDFFEHMAGWPFSEIDLGNLRFDFSTVEGAYPTAGATVIPVAVGQNLAASIPFPSVFQKLFDALGLTPPSTEILIVGSIVLDRALAKDTPDPTEPDPSVELYPDMELRAYVDLGTHLDILGYFSVGNPYLGLRVRTAVADSPDATPTLLAMGEPAPETGKAHYQSPEILLGMELPLEESVLDLETVLGPKSGGSSSDGEPWRISFALTPDPKGAPLTPAVVVQDLVKREDGPGDSLFGFVPAPLQRFIRAVEFRGLLLNGSLGASSDDPGASGGVSSVSIALGSSSSNPLVVLPGFEIDSFDLAWTVLDPFGRPHHLIGFSTVLTLWPDVFKKGSQGGDGKFHLSIDQDLNLDGSFGGDVYLSKLLSLAGIEPLNCFPIDPLSVEASLSVRPSDHSYAVEFNLESLQLIKDLLLLQNVAFELSAVTSHKSDDELAALGWLPDGESGTVFKGELSGLILIGEETDPGSVAVEASVAYDGSAEVKAWQLHAALARPLALSLLLNQLFPSFGFPRALGTLTVVEFTLDATLPTSSSEGLLTGGAERSFEIHGAMDWDFTGVFGVDVKGDVKADCSLKHVSNGSGSANSGSILAELALKLFDGVSIDIVAGYKFSAGDEPSKQLFIQWEGVTGTYDIEAKKVTFKLAGWTVGKIIQKLVTLVGDPYFTLPAPWDVLNKISLDGLSVTLDLSKNAKHRISASYKLSSPLELGFAKIEALNFRLVDGKPTLAIDADVRVPGLKDSDLFDPEKGEDVREISGDSVPGHGSKLLDLRLLMLGQHVGIEGRSFDSTTEAIQALKDVGDSSGQTNPVPAVRKDGQPYYEQKNNWLVATDFGILYAGQDSKTEKDLYTIDLQILFDDPNLYGLHLALNGDRVRCLDGLRFDILYKKISEGLGVYQIELTLPDTFRTLTVGAYTITLPIIGFQIYTDGSFLIDFGFPYHLDFSRSLTIQGIIMFGPVPVPVLGSVGFYFGVLSSAAGPRLPATTKGTFHPVIAFGMGLQIGVGKYINKGVLKAGFSVTVFGIVEGVLAPYHPYEASGKTAEYFRVRGTVGIIGKLYGCVDFGIIKADLSIVVEVYAQIEAEAYRDVHLSVIASVEVKLSVKIHVAFIHITLHFHFHTEIQAKLTIRAGGTAPWSAAALAGGREALAAVSRRGPDWRPMALDFRVPVRAAGEELPKINMILTTAYTVLPTHGGSTSEDLYEGALVILLSMDAPAPNGSEASQSPADGEDGASFVNLCRELLPWVLASVPPPLKAGNEDAYSKEYLEDILDSLAWLDRPIPSGKILEFLKTSFEIDVVAPPQGKYAAAPAASVVFPVFDGLSAEFPLMVDAEGDRLAHDEPPNRVAFGDYTKVTPQYRQTIRKLFDEVAAAVQDEAAGSDSDLMIDVTPESIADVVFEDYFVLVARQLLQAAIDGFDGFLYDLGNGSAVADVLKWANEDRDNAITVSDIVTPNQDQPLVEKQQVDLTDLTYTVQQGDTLESIVDAYTTPERCQLTVLEIIQANVENRSMVRPGVTLSLEGKSHTTALGDSFASIADALDVKTEQDWANLANATKSQSELLAPTARIRIGALVQDEHGPDTIVLRYITAFGKLAELDTLATIQSRFGATLVNVFGLDYETQTSILLGPIPSHRNTFLQFAASEGQTTIPIANLTSLEADDLWAGIERSGRVVDIAGMASRFMLHGLRLPDREGLTLPEEFPYAADSDYGLYQLTGQQLPTQFFGDRGHSFALAKDETLHWLAFDGDKGTTQFEVPVTKPAECLALILDYVNRNGFDPGATLSVTPAVELVAKRLPVRHSTVWSTSDLSGVGRVALAGDDAGPAPQPILWAVPHSILRRCEEVWSNLLKAFPKATPSDLEAYLPLYTPQAAETDPATHKTTFTDIGAYALATKVDFQVRRLAQTDDMAPQTPDDNDVIPSDGSKKDSRRKLAPFTYEVIGPSASDAILLQRILTTIGSSGSAEHISGLHILYTDRAASPSGLVSQGGSEFVSFLARTNLSTETHPTFAAVHSEPEEEGTGILNETDFLRVLWEESTVRSGGYYLYYKDLVHDRGLPDELFGADETATLTVVVLYKRSPDGSAGARFTDHVNAFVTVETIDVDHATVALESESSPSSSLPLANEMTLQKIADLYGIGVGDVAALNPTQPIVPGTNIPISGVLHHVSRTDIEGGKSFDALAGALATHYSVEKSEILNWNPGLKGKTGNQLLFSVVRIPPIALATSSGDTIDSIRCHLNLEIGALADMMRNTTPFAEKATLKLDSQLYDVKATLGAGNAAMRITRPRPPDVDPGKAGFAKAALASLYTLMESRLCGVPDDGQTLPAPYNDLFRESGFGMPIGPRDPSDREKTSQVLDHLRPVGPRGELDDDTVVYAQTLGFRGFSRVNPATDNGEIPLFDVRANPYIGVGGFAQIDAYWTDLFGNRAARPVCDDPGASAEGGTADTGWSSPPIPVRYTDRLIGVGQWPSVQARYTYGVDKATSAPQLEVSLTLDTSPYEPSEGEDWGTVLGRIEQDRKVFERVYFQLHQDYDRVQDLLPGLSGNAVSMNLRHSLLKKESQTIPLKDREDQVRKFVEDCLAFLSLLRDVSDSGSAPAGGPSTALTFLTPFDELTPESIAPMEVSLSLERQGVLCTPALRGIVDGTSVTCRIQPDLSANGTDAKAAADGQDIKYFAEVVERVFDTEAWQLRGGTGPKDPAQPDNRESYSIWAVRMGKTKDVGIYYEFGEGLGYYAPMPLATELWSGQVQIDALLPIEGDGSGSTITFTGVDLNEWFAQVLRAVDSFLSPRFTGPVFLYDDKNHTTYLKDILDDKKTLAEAIARSVRPILVTSATDDATRKAAQEKLEQALLNRLSAADDLTAVVVAPVRDAVSNEPSRPGVRNPRLYGQPVDAMKDPEDGANARNFALSTGKIPLNPKDEAAEGISHLAFLFSSKNPEKHSSVEMVPVYALTHLEHGIVSVPGIKGYEQISWINFVTGPFVTAFAYIDETKKQAKHFLFPVVLRALPMPPTMKSQTFIPGHTDEEGFAAVPEDGDASDLAKWTYAFAFDHAYAAQDSVEVTVWLNVDLSQRLEAADLSLITALANFITEYPQVAKGLEKLLSDDKTTGDESNTSDDALETFETLVKNVATAYAAWVGPTDITLTASAPVAQHVSTYRIELVPDDPEEDPDDARALVNVYLRSQQGAAPPIPIIFIDPENYDPEVLASDEREGAKGAPLVSYLYVKKQKAETDDEPEYLSYHDALAIPERVVHVEGLDIFAVQNAWAAAQILRNVNLVEGVETTDTFKFRTPQVKFAEPLVPLLAYDKFEAGSMKRSDISGPLGDFFVELFEGAPTELVEVKLETAISSELAPAVENLPRTQLPVNLLPPTDVKIGAGEAPDFVSDLAKDIDRWLDANAPVIDETSKLNFNLHIFASPAANGAEGMPLLSVRNLFWDLKDDKVY